MLTTREVAARFGVTQQTVRRWCAQGLLKGAQQVGEGQRSVWIVPESALEGFEPPRPRRPKREDR